MTAGPSAAEALAALDTIDLALRGYQDPSEIHFRGRDTIRVFVEQAAAREEALREAFEEDDPHEALERIRLVLSAAGLAGEEASCVRCGHPYGHGGHGRGFCIDRRGSAGEEADRA